jgi:hypothetical protein
MICYRSMTDLLAFHLLISMPETEGIASVYCCLIAARRTGDLEQNERAGTRHDFWFLIKLELCIGVV